MEVHGITPAGKVEPLKPEGPWRLLLKEAEGSSHVLEEVAAFIPSPSELRDYAGVYSSEEIASRCEIKLEPAGLVLLRPKKKPDALQPVTRDDFAGWIGNIRFIRNSHGDVPVLCWTTELYRIFGLRKTGSQFRRSENGLLFRDRFVMKLEPELHRTTLCVYMRAHFATASTHGA